MHRRTKKLIAFFFLAVLAIQTLLPGAAYALTSGPSQPEMQKFEPAGVSDLVDLFTGDFKYNIPLLDVDGYPVNLSYQSGTGMEEEASWVGLGWSLNPGAINRQMRGLPDDFDGSKEDKIVKQYTRKPFRKVGGQVVLKPSLFAWELGSASVKLGVYKDNYYGIGAEVGASLGFQLAKNKKTSLTAGLGIGSDSRSGVSISPSLSLSRAHDLWTDESARSISGSFEYNTRSGLKQVSLDASFSTTKYRFNVPAMELSAVKYFGQSYTPSFTTNTFNSSGTLSFDFGGTFWGVFAGVGGSGYVYTESILQKTTSAPAFGYMNYLKGRKNKNALLDFNREKDGVFISSTPAIPIPVATQDFFIASGQTGSMQFRPFFSGNYVVFDKAHFNNSLNTKAGFTIGVGNLHKNGARLDVTAGNAQTGKWTNNNEYLDNAEATFNIAAQPDEEAVYLKQTGENTKADDNFLTQVRNDETVTVAVNDLSNVFPKAKAYKAFKSREAGRVSMGVIKKNNREIRTNTVSYLTANQARKYGLDKTINGQDIRESDYRKENHMSEVTVTDKEGRRMVYGIPVYNIEQREATFSVANPSPLQLEQTRRNGLIGYTPNLDNGLFNFKGRDNLFSRDIMPGYATSFLLTGILSPDYVDVNDDGITDDDLGSAIKFKYNKLSQDYHWRAPYAQNMANYNEGYISDPKDDKAGYVYGKKEMWYLDAIESKTMIALFETSDREDGLGVLGENGGQNTSVKLKKLDRIKLYSKADWVKNGVNAIPIKTVHFEYDYSLCPDVPNNSGIVITPNPYDPNNPENINAAKGKLTLKKVYFTFGTSSRGKSNPYEFEYETRLVNNVFTTLPNPYNDANHPETKNSYAERQADRWGTYKPTWYNHLTGNTGEDGKLNNSEFPYTIQPNNDDNTTTDFDERALADFLAAKWQLNKIITPAGSTINIEYEADNYTYVQNRRAMQMCFVKGVGNTIGADAGMINSSGFVVELPETVSSVADLQNKYLRQADGQLMKQVFYKIFTDINRAGNYEYIQGYAELVPGSCTILDNGKKAFIAVKKLDGNKYNPVSRAAWQMLKSDLPQLAYDNYDNSDANSFGADFIAAINSLVFAIVNLRELGKPFESTASGRSYADKIDLSKSMVRLFTPMNTGKTGGGSRVHKLTISDDWQTMTNSIGKTAKYGQLYEYKTQGPGNTMISSGVAAYEPQIGNEENPFHEPVPYTEKVHWSRDKYHYIEKPFCETWFPSAVVGYSKVTVTGFGDNYASTGILDKHTGYMEHEFYTAKDFPTLVDNLTLETADYENGLILKLFSSVYYKRVVTTQGFKIEVNDMHGKMKSVRDFNKGGDLVSSTEYYYQVENENAAEKKLDNNVDVLEKGTDGVVANRLLATDIDFVTDVRESSNESIGTSVGAYSGGIFTGFFLLPYLPYGAVNFGYSVTTDSYNSVSTVKIIHRFGILKKVRTTQNGSSILAENLVWDEETGEVVLSRTQNEFNDFIYSFNYPAYRAEGHEGMGGAYKNTGAVFMGLTIPASGLIDDDFYTSPNVYLFPGDELVSLNDEKKGWVIKSADGKLYLVDAKGEFISATGDFMVLRSGKRNLAGASVGSIVCMKNPIADFNGVKKLFFNVDNRILDAKAISYSDQWGVPVPHKPDTTVYCPTPFIPEVETTGNFYVDNQNPTQCNGLFEARRSAITDLTGRGFLNYASLATIPPEATIISAKLSLYTATTVLGDQDAAYLKRVTEFGNCAFGVDWNTQPAVTDAHQVLLSGNPIPQDLIDIDITDMFTEWFHLKDNITFAIRISLANEFSNGRIAFYGLDGEGPPYQKTPVLKVCYSLEDKCVDPLTIPVNPYVKGLLGNWRAKENFAYTISREQKPGMGYQNGGTNIRQSGYYSSFKPFWIFQSSGSLQSTVQPEPIVPSELWIRSNKSIYYDQKGNEIESANALDIYGSALFGYRESVAIAVAANARRNEIAFDGFEDYYFYLQEGEPEKCPLNRHFDWGLVNQFGTWSGPAGIITSQKSHTGKYSYALSSSTLITKSAGNPSPSQQLLGYDAQGRYQLLSNELAEGFAPVNGKKYVLSLWVNETETQVTNKVTKLAVTINGQPYDLNNLVVPVVEGWKRLELTFTAGATFNLQLVPTGTVYVDDVRILPFDGQLGSYVYDDRTMRLTAQLDENNFATFYEYDDEGTPIRVKKETERGVMTLKENRQSFRNRE